MKTINKGREGCEAFNQVEGRANCGARIRSRHGAPSFVTGNQTPFADRATLVDLKRVFLTLINRIEP